MTERDKTNTPAAHAVVQDQSRQLTTPDSALNSPVRQDDEFNLLQALTILVGSWRLLVFTPVAVGMLTAVTLFILPAKYEATATFVPEAPSGGSIALHSFLLAYCRVGRSLTGYLTEVICRF